MSVLGALRHGVHCGSSLGFLRAHNSVQPSKGFSDKAILCNLREAVVGLPNLSRPAPGFEYLYSGHTDLFAVPCT